MRTEIDQRSSASLGTSRHRKQTLLSEIVR